MCSAGHATGNLYRANEVSARDRDARCVEGIYVAVKIEVDRKLAVYSEVMSVDLNPSSGCD